MSRPVVNLRLDLSGFDEAPFLYAVERCKREGIRFTTMAELGDSDEHRLALYELNKTCSKDIPARGEFFTFDEFAKRRFGASYDPAGVILALDGGLWIGLSATADFSSRGLAFNEMTGVLRSHRRRGIAVALKVLAIRYARRLGVDQVHTIHDFENTAAIELNLGLGYVHDERPTGADT